MLRSTQFRSKAKALNLFVSIGKRSLLSFCVITFALFFLTKMNFLKRRPLPSIYFVWKPSDNWWPKMVFCCLLQITFCFFQILQKKKKIQSSFNSIFNLNSDLYWEPLSSSFQSILNFKTILCKSILPLCIERWCQQQRVNLQFYFLVKWVAKREWNDHAKKREQRSNKPT
jgi:hypothetical protein